MSVTRIRPRASIIDADLARHAVVDLPVARQVHRPHTPRGLVRTLASFRRPIEPDRIIVMTLAPVTVRAGARRR